MKKFKKLIPAMCMLLVSALMLGSSTFAWFAINNKATAKDMEVAVKANTQYFVISADTDFTANDMSVGITDFDGGIGGEKAVHPVSYLKDAAAATALIAKIEGGTYVGTTTPPKAGDWYTANSTAYNAAVSDKLANVKNVTMEANDYFVKYTFNVGLAASSSDFNGTLEISVSAADGAVHGAVNAVVVINGKASAAAAAAKTTVTNGLFTETDRKITTTDNYYLSASASSYVTVEVYVYVDGTNTSVKSDIEDINVLKGKFDIVVEGLSA